LCRDFSFGSRSQSFNRNNEGCHQRGKENISKSAESFLKALLLSDFTSIRFLAKERGARGITGLCDLLRESAEKIQVN